MTEFQNQEKEGPMTYFMVSLLCFAGAAFFYYVFSDVETNGGTIRLNRTFRFLYQMGGKSLISLILCIVGGYFTFKAIKMNNKE